MIYIQKADGLLPISAQLTKEKILAALGYTPADNATFYEDESGALLITDHEGYVIARIDSEGLETTKVSAKAIQLNGEDLAEKLKALEEKSMDLEGYATEQYVNDAIANIDTSNIDLSKYALSSEVEANKNSANEHINNADIHVNLTEKNAWNAKSDFSGNYSDLQNAPNISTSEEDNELIVCDSKGNIIMQVNAAGINTAGIFINGKSLTNQENSLSGKRISILGDSISTYSGHIPSGYATYYPKGDVNSVNKTWWQLLIDNNNMIIGQNASYSGSMVQSDGSNSYLNDDRIAALGVNGIPDIIIIEGSTNDGSIEDLTASGEIVSTLPTLPLTNANQSTYDTTTFVGAY